MKLEKYDIVLLYSGGLDSILTGTILAKQGLKILGVKFVHPFSPGKWEKAEIFYESEFGFDILETSVGDDFLQIIKNPEHGYGKNANPCIDCKIYFFRKAWEIAQQVGAQGLATGEVTGQRPFSQRKEALRLIEQSAAVKGKVVRPLCAILLPPSEPEIEGIVCREKLYDIRGRSRKKQIELARQFGIENYESPGGGCNLTDPQYAYRFLDALEHNELSLQMTQLIKIGRHFRVEGKRIVVGRNEYENEILEKDFAADWIFMEPASVKGPSALVACDSSENTISTATSIIARYITKAHGEEIEIETIYPDGSRKIITAIGADHIWVDRHLICK